MKILTVGDLVGKSGVAKLKSDLSKIVSENNVDFIIVNGENAADGMGLTQKQYNDILSCGVDVVTMGNHTWGKKEIFNFIDDEQIVRPANYTDNNPGHGYTIRVSKNGKRIAVINLIGRVTMGILSENPFLIGKKIVDKIKDQVDIIVIDMHGEATAEKKALLCYLDGQVNIIFGTHTHVQTADEFITENGTGFITDIGMTGPINSVIGMDIDTSIKRFETGLPEKYRVAEGDSSLNSVLFTLDDNTNKVIEIKRINM